MTTQEKKSSAEGTEGKETSKSREFTELISENKNDKPSTWRYLMLLPIRQTAR